MNSGGIVTYNTMLGADPAEPAQHVTVTHYQGTAGNNVMMAGHVKCGNSVLLMGAERVEMGKLTSLLNTAAGQPLCGFQGRGGNLSFL